jgi:hypothetical protein
LLLLVVFTAWGQGKKSDKAEKDDKSGKADTVKIDYRPTGVRIGTDAISIARNFYDKSFSGWEVNADIDFYRYYLALDVGSWSRNYLPDGGTYDNKGTYWRLGADVNFLLKDPDRNMLFFGLRYGHANFSENLTVVTTDPIWGEFNRTYANDGVTARWFEMVTGLRVKIWKPIWIGYTARFKFGLKTNETGDLIPSDVPGYGSTDKDNTWGFNYQIFFKIPVRKQPTSVAPSK